MNKEYTGEGYEIVYISEYFFNILERELEKIARIPGNPSPYPMIALRDEPAMIEFRRLEKKHEQ